VNNHYNDGGEVVSYLEFGAIATSPPIKKIYDFRTMQQAYDWFMHARYSQDISCYIWMLQALSSGDLSEVGRLYQELIHHPDDFSSNLSKWAALQTIDDLTPIYYEHGQTLFGCIEGIACCATLLDMAKIPMARPELTVQGVAWEGFDISPFFNLMAKQLHGNCRIQTYSDEKSIPSRVSVAFAKGVTLLYAVRSPEDFFLLFSRAVCGVFDISFNVHGQGSLALGTGKQVCYLSLDSFADYYRSHSSIILLRRNASGLRNDDTKLYIEGIVCKDAETTQRFIQNDATFRDGLQAAFPELSGKLLHRSDREYLDWIEFSEFLELCRL